MIPRGRRSLRGAVAGWALPRARPTHAARLASSAVAALVAVACLHPLAMATQSVQSPSAPEPREVPQARPSAAPVAPPTLILPGALDPNDSPMAAMTLEQLVRSLEPIGGADPDSGPEGSEPDVAEANVEEATRLYVNGRVALAEGKTLTAVRTLERALAADPTSVAILLTLARAYQKAGNAGMALELHERVLTLDPKQPEALYSRGWRATEADDHTGVVRALGGLFLLPAERRQEALADARPGAESFVELALSRSLRRLGADAATVEVLGRAVVRADDMGGVARARAEAIRALGDAYARRGDLPAAVSAWRVGLPAADPLDSAILEPRLAWALVALDRPREAVGRLASRVEAGSVSDVDVALAAWLQDVGADDEGLAQVAARAATLTESPEAQRLVRAIRGEAPARDEIGDDRRALREALAARQAAAGTAAAVQLANELLAARPELAIPLVDALLRCGADAPSIIDACRDLGAGGAALHARVLSIVDDLGAAWVVVNEARGAKPEDRALLRAALVVASRLGEPSFVSALAADVDPQDPLSLIDLATAHRACGDVDKGIEAAVLATSASAVAGGASPKVAALAHLALAQARADAAARRASVALAQEAVDAVTAAVGLDQANEDAWGVLVLLWQALGSAEAQDRGASRPLPTQTIDELAKSMPQGPVRRALTLERWIAGGAGLDAIHAAAACSAADLSESRVLKLLVGELLRQEAHDAALAFLDARLAATPGDATAWQLWTEASISSGNGEAALERLAARADGVRRDPIALRLKELALRALDRGAEADALVASRSSSLPPSPRRSLERAAQALARGDDDAAAAALEGAVEHASSLQQLELLAAAELSARLRNARTRARLVDIFAKSLIDAAEAGGEVEPVAVARAAALIALDGDPQGDPDGQLRRMIEVAVRHTRSVGAGEVPAWIAIGQSYADRARHEEGAAFLTALLRGEARFDSGAGGRLARACFALDAAAGGGAQRSMAVLDLLRSRGLRPFARPDRTEDTDSEALVALSTLYTIVGDRRGAMEILRESIRRNPMEAMALNNLAWDALERGRTDPETVDLIERAYRLKPDDAAILDSIGWLRYLQGIDADTPEREGALTLLTRAVERSGDEVSGEVLDHLGDARWRQGDRQGAVVAWQAAEKAINEHFPRELTMRQLPAYERGEHGVLVTDPERFWERQYGGVITRVRAKLAAVSRGEPPPIAGPLADPTSK